MGEYIKRNRRPIVGVALPVFFIFILMAIGLSVSPGWINPTYGNPGDSCKGTGTSAVCFGTNVDPLFFACDACKGEFCVPFNDSTTLGECGVVSSSTITTDPNAVSDPGALPCTNQDAPPLCWIKCHQVLTDTNLPTPSGAFQCNSAICELSEPNDDFCNEIAGGNQAHPCRSGTCQTDSTPNTNNLSGCDYEFVDGPDCVLCASPAPSSFDSCGNGVCEAGQGEDCETCAFDCLVPGFEGNCPLTTGNTIEDACNTSFIAFTSFIGPPYNVQGTGMCEDGDVCTDNQCDLNDNCDSEPKDCSVGEADLCCPAGCNPPTEGICDENDLDCDVDCLVAETCESTEETGGGSEVGSDSDTNGGCSLKRSVRASEDVFAWILAMIMPLCAYPLVFRHRKINNPKTKV